MRKQRHDYAPRPRVAGPETAGHRTLARLRAGPYMIEGRMPRSRRAIARSRIWN